MLRDKNRPLSWSAISSFEYDPEQWYKKYILKQEEPPTEEMIFGKNFGKSVEDGKPWAPVTMYNKPEYQFSCVFKGIPLIGYADSFDTTTNSKLAEYKTSGTLWTQDKVDNHGQLTMYALMNFIINKVIPEDLDILLECIQTQKNGDFSISFKQPIKVHQFKTKRTTIDILNFGERILRIVKEMDKYCEDKLSTPVQPS